MAKTALEDFLSECLAPDPEGDGLSMDELYGLYLSWCGLKGFAPVRGRTFRAGLWAVNIRPDHRGSRCPELMMVGPAACDYLIHRELPLLVLDTPSGRPQPGSPGGKPVTSLAGRQPGDVRGSVPAA